MKKKPAPAGTAEDNTQSNMGYENTEVRTDRDDMENTKAQPSAPTGKKEPVENKDDSAGLRSESGKKTLGNEEE